MYTILKLIQTAWYLFSHSENKNNERSCNSPQQLLLIDLPIKILSKIILELLNEWSFMKAPHVTYLRGNLDVLETVPELSTNCMIPLSRVNKFFHELVWTITFKYSHWDPHIYLLCGFIQGRIMIRTKPFVFSQSMLKSRGIEQVNQFHITGPLCKKQHWFVQNLMLDVFPFLFISVGTGLQRSFTLPKLQFLTRFRISTTFVGKTAKKYKRIEQQFSNYHMEHHYRFEEIGIELPAYVQDEMNRQTSTKFAIRYKILCYHEVLICNAIAKMVSQLDHPVNCQVFNCYPKCKELEILLWCFAKKNIISQVGTLELRLTSKYNNCRECAKLFGLLNLDNLFLLNVRHGFVTQELATLLIENNPRLRILHCDDSNVLHLNLPGNLQILKIGSSPFFSKLKIPLSQQFPRLIKLNLHFHSQIGQKYINGTFLHIPTLQTLKVSGSVSTNIELICCFLESNSNATTFSIYQNDHYESLEPIYRHLLHVKLLDMSYRDRWEDIHHLKFNIESLLDVILRNASSLEIILIHKSKKTKPILFSKLAAKLACDHEQNTKYLRYLYIYTDKTNANELVEQNLVANFFADLEDDKSKLSPYNPDIKKLYRIDSLTVDNRIDPGRCRLEIDVREIRKLLTASDESG
jgi:hypothetical protein